MAYKVDFHTHTYASPDGSLNGSDFERVFQKGKLDVIAVTDHNEIGAALELKEQFKEKIIVGEEIMSNDGEIIGLFLSKVIKAGMSAQETIDAIKDQNGIAYIPHPFQAQGRHSIARATIDELHGVDIIEVRNGRSYSSKAQQEATYWARSNNVAQAAASDAHGRIGWGRVYTELAEIPTRDTLLDLMHKSTLHGSTNGVFSYAYPTINRARKGSTNK